jgi:predicted phage terminase large subunit-like protein
MRMSLSKEDRDAATRLAILTARDDLLAFIMLMNPGFSVGPHHRVLCDELMKLEKNDIDRLMIFISPRASKSLITSTYFPAWALGRNPYWQEIAVSHSDDLATRFGRSIRDIITSTAYQTIFPKINIRKDNRSANSWALEHNKNQAGSFLAAGSGSGIAGFGAHLAIIDDPISEQDAYSKTRREHLNNWYASGLRTRLMPGGKIVLVMTRWHENDLAGHLLKAEDSGVMADKWSVVSIPALNTTESSKKLKKGRDDLISQGYLTEEYPKVKRGESFWPASDQKDGFCWTTEELIRTKNNTPAFKFDALYMQAPTNEEGGIIKDKWWQEWDKPTPPECDYIIQSWDTAFSTRTTADYSACTTWGIFNSGFDMPNVILLGAERGRWDFPTLREKVVSKFEEHDPDTVLIEKKASGQSLIQDLRMTGIPIQDYQPDRDKVARTYAITSLFHNGRIYAPFSKAWAKEVMDEARTFPSGAHDDYMDTLTQALLWIRNGGYVTHKDDTWLDKAEESIYNRNRRAYY